jgi:hypothetical protein
MTTTTYTNEYVASPAAASPRPLWRAGAASAVAAAAATTVVALGARAGGVSLTIDGEPILLVAFPQLTVIASVIGVVLAVALRRWAKRPQRTFVSTTVALTVVSFVPDLMVPASAATTATLMSTHVVAAAIVVPALAARLQTRR